MDKRIELLIVCLGCFLGGGFRYLAEFFVSFRYSDQFAILMVNLVGCFIIGIVTALVTKKTVSKSWGKFLTTGFCGGLTTFSSFASGINRLMFFGSTGLAVVYIVLNMVLGILFVYLGCFFVLGDKLGEIFD